MKKLNRPSFKAVVIMAITCFALLCVLIHLTVPIQNWSVGTIMGLVSFGFSTSGVIAYFKETGKLK